MQIIKVARATYFEHPFIFIPSPLLIEIIQIRVPAMYKGIAITMLIAMMASTTIGSVVPSSVEATGVQSIEDRVGSFSPYEYEAEPFRVGGMYHYRKEVFSRFE